MWDEKKHTLAAFNAESRQEWISCIQQTNDQKTKEKNSQATGPNAASKENRIQTKPEAEKLGSPANHRTLHNSGILDIKPS